MARAHPRHRCVAAQTSCQGFNGTAIQVQLIMPAAVTLYSQEAPSSNARGSRDRGVESRHLMANSCLWYLIATSAAKPYVARHGLTMKIRVRSICSFERLWPWSPLECREHHSAFGIQFKMRYVRKRATVGQLRHRVAVVGISNINLTAYDTLILAVVKPDKRTGTSG